MREFFIWPILWYLSFFARLALYFSHPTVIGITGSVGKSSTRNALDALLSDHFQTKVIQKGNSETGIPLGILGIHTQSLGFSSGIQGVIDWIGIILRVPFSIFYIKNTQYLIVEMGVDEPTPPKNMSYLLTIIKPHIVTILNVSTVHSMQFAQHLGPYPSPEKVMSTIAYEKCKIVTENNQVQLTIYNRDDEFITHALKNFTQGVIKTFGSHSTDDVSYTDYIVSVQKTQFAFKLKGNSKKDLILNFQDVALPQEYQEVFAPTILIGLHAGLYLEQISESLQKHFEVPEGRFSVFAGINDSIILDSSYNASPRAVTASLKLLKKLVQENKQSAVFVFGDMRELGPLEKEKHEHIAHQIKQTVDYIYCIGPLTKQYVIPLLGRKKNVRWFENAHQAGAYLQKNLPAGSIVLVKGSQNTIYLEETIKYILKNKKDEQKLCRQEPYWMKIKQNYFTSSYLRR